MFTEPITTKNPLTTLTTQELETILTRIARNHPEYKEYLDAGLERAVKYPPKPHYNLERYLTMCIKHAMLNEIRDQHLNRSIPLSQLFPEGDLSDELPTGERFRNLFAFFTDDQCDSEFATVEKDWRLPAWLDMVRRNLIAAQVLGLVNRYGRKETSAWQRRRVILDLYVQLAEMDEYDADRSLIKDWLLQQLAARGYTVERDTLTNDLVELARICQEFIYFAQTAPAAVLEAAGFKVEKRVSRVGG